MTSLSVAVMAHPTRLPFIPSLLDRLGVTDDRVVWDQNNDRWDTGRRAMAAYDPTCSHHMVVQDDAIVPPNLLAGVTEALAHIPAGAAMCIYAGRTRKFWTLVEHTKVTIPDEPCWLVMRQIHWGVGVVFPVEHIADMTRWGDQHGEVPNWDKRLSRWCEQHEVDVWYPFPSLVDHRESPSLVPGRGMHGRRAKQFIGSETSVLSQRWDRPVVRMSRLRGI